MLDLNLNFLPVGDPFRNVRDYFMDNWENPEMATWEARDVKDRVAGLSVLQALRLQARTLYDIGTLTQLPLRHLQLEINDSVVIAGINKLGKLAHLETLMVECCHNPEYFAANSKNGGLLLKMDLRACTKLRAVAFNIFVPNGLEVPPGCSVHLMANCWVLTDISSACTSCTSLVSNAQELSEFLGDTFTALKCLKIDATLDPKESERDEDELYPPLDVRLGDNVRHLKSLSIQNHPESRGINLDILGTKQLTSLVVLTEGELNLNISNVACLAAALQMYRIKCDRHYSEHADVQALHSAVVSLGKGDDIIFGCHPDSGCGVFLYELCWVSRAAGIDVRDVEDHLAACSCMACWDCLKRAGGFDPLLV
ncbi:hypothetical protein COCOBI_02-0400 [Coccomyxa sp. Obi]|nr:hypothetical protein COCOBI_02-0400 [Coccomyxa sp. Obi]